MNLVYVVKVFLTNKGVDTLKLKKAFKSKRAAIQWGESKLDYLNELIWSATLTHFLSYHYTIEPIEYIAN